MKNLGKGSKVRNGAQITREGERKETIHTVPVAHLIKAASDRNFSFSSCEEPFLMVFTATGVGPESTANISMAVPWYTSPNSPRSIKLSTDNIYIMAEPHADMGVLTFLVLVYCEGICSYCPGHLDRQYSHL